MNLASFCKTLLTSLLFTNFLFIHCAASASDKPFVQDAFVDASGRNGPLLVTLPGGQYESANNTGHPAFVLSPFAMAVNDVTNAEFTQFLNEHGGLDANGIDFLAVPSEEAPPDITYQNGSYQVMAGRATFPVTGVSWQGATAYTHWLSQKTGQIYRLPTEIQWEYAARAGSAARWPWGDTFSVQQANCGKTDTAARAMPVGSYPANAWGLHDMVGNVWQWMADCFPQDLAALGTQDPSGFLQACTTPSIRGGGAANAIEQCQPGFRANYWWRGLQGHIGFRVIRQRNGESVQ